MGVALNVFRLVLSRCSGTVAVCAVGSALIAHDPSGSLFPGLSGSCDSSGTVGGDSSYAVCAKAATSQHTVRLHTSRLVVTYSIVAQYSTVRSYY